MGAEYNKVGWNVPAYQMSITQKKMKKMQKSR